MVKLRGVKTVITKNGVIGILTRGDSVLFICPFCGKMITCKTLWINDRKIYECTCKRCKFRKYIPGDAA